MPNLSNQPPQFYLTSPAGGVQVQSASTIKLQPNMAGLEFTTLDYIISKVVNPSAQITARASQLGQAVLIHSPVSSLLSEGPGPYSLPTTSCSNHQLVPISSSCSVCIIHCSGLFWVSAISCSNSVHLPTSVICSILFK